MLVADFATLLATYEKGFCIIIEQVSAVRAWEEPMHQCAEIHDRIATQPSSQLPPNLNNSLLSFPFGRMSAPMNIFRSFSSAATTPQSLFAPYSSAFSR